MFVEKVKPYKADFHGDVRTLVTGLSYQCPDDWEFILNSLDSQSDITLRKEPGNPHDEFAIAAYLGDRRIGYVSKDDNTAITMFMGNEPVRCEVIEKYKASFKVSFEHPKKFYEDFTIEQIFELQSDCEYKGYDKELPSYEIPILEIDDNHYDWYDDRILLPNMEKWIVDFNRKFVSNKIELVCRQASDGKFYYYLPYLNWDIAEVRSQEICEELERLGVGIGLVDVATLTYQDTIVADLKVGLRKDYSGISAMSFFRLKRENNNFNFVYEIPKVINTIPISEEVFSKFFMDNLNIDVSNVPNRLWEYEMTDFLGNGAENYETYVFKKRGFWKGFKEITANVVKGICVNLFIDEFEVKKEEMLEFIYKYKKLFFPDYTLEQCKNEYGDKETSFFIEGISPSLSISPPIFGSAYSICFYTDFCNKEYIKELISKRSILTLLK